MTRKYFKTKKQQQVESFCVKLAIISIFWTIGLSVAFQDQIKSLINAGIVKLQNKQVVQFDGQGPFSDALANKHNLFVYKTIYANKN